MSNCPAATAPAQRALPNPPPPPGPECRPPSPQVSIHVQSLRNPAGEFRVPGASRSQCSREKLWSREPGGCYSPRFRRSCLRSDTRRVLSFKLLSLYPPPPSRCGVTTSSPGRERAAGTHPLKSWDCGEACRRPLTFPGPARCSHTRSLFLFSSWVPRAHRGKGFAPGPRQWLATRNVRA